MANLSVQRGPGMFEFVDELKDAPERLDKDMRASFRRLSMPIRDKARARIKGAHPVAKVKRNRKGTYRWNMLANSVTSSASSIAPTIRYGSERVPGWGGWEFGSNRFKQFPSKRKVGPFYRTIEEARPEVDEETQKVVEQYMELHFGRQ